MSGGLVVMLAAHWRSGRRALLIWVIGMIGVFAASVASIDNLYGTPKKLAGYAAAIGSGDAAVAINGQPYGVDTLGGVVAYEFGFMSTVAFPLMGILLVARWTRREEQSGRLELVRSGAVSRTAPLVAALLLTAAAFALVAAGFTVSLAAFGIAWVDALLYSAALGALGLWFAALTAVAAQVVERTRAVYAVALAVLIVGFVLRGVGDVRDNALTWLSPLGWMEETRAFAEARWWPLALPAALAVALVGAAFAIADRRDLGSGVLAARPGPTRANAPMLNSVGLAVRMHRNLIAAWAAVAVLVGAAFGSLVEPIKDLTRDNAAVQDVFGGAGADAFLAFVVVLLALVSGGFVLQAAGRMSEEERDGRLEPVLAGSLGRVRWLAGHALAIGAGTFVVALLGGLALGIGVATASGEPGEVSRLTGSTLAYVPAVLVIGALTVTLYAARPALQSVGWLAYAFVAIAAMLGDTLQLPEWARNISPLDWVGRVPVDPTAWWALATAGAVTAALGGLAAMLLRRRDIPAG